MNAELTFLQFLQSLHSPMLDGSMCFITRLGDSGILWVTLTAVLLVFRKTRRVGCVLAAALLSDAFSRMYLCVHYPTDILGGVILGAACGWAGAWLVKKAERRMAIPRN